MRPLLRQAHAEMPWTRKFQEALTGSLNKSRTLGRLLKFYRERRQGTYPKWGWTWYQRSLAHNLRQQLFEQVSRTVIFAVDLNVLVGLPATAPNATTHTGSAAFVQADWVDLCHRLYPKTLMTLLNSRPTKMPKWIAKRWRPFQRLSAACKRLGKPVDVLLCCLRLCIWNQSGGVMT